MRCYAVLCGIMRCYADLCGVMRSYAELFGLILSYAVLCGIMRMVIQTYSDLMRYIFSIILTHSVSFSIIWTKLWLFNNNLCYVVLIGFIQIYALLFRFRQFYSVSCGIMRSKPERSDWVSTA